jgi:TRAP-type C4-dicarboxylate transport system permease small subunit
MNAKRDIFRLSNAFDQLLNLGAFLGGGILVITMGCISYEVVMRYLFNNPTTWVVDMSGLALYVFTFLATGWVLKEEGHTKIDILLLCLGNRASRFIQAMVSYMGTAVCGVLFVQTLIDAIGTYLQKELLWLAFALPAHVLLWLMPFGFLLLSIQFARRGWAFTRRVREPAER